MRDIGTSLSELVSNINTNNNANQFYRKGKSMNDFTVYYNAEGMVLIELDYNGLELTRAEAEQLFVDLGHVLQAMDDDNDRRD